MMPTSPVFNLMRVSARDACAIAKTPWSAQSARNNRGIGVEKVGKLTIASCKSITSSVVVILILRLNIRCSTLQRI
jgi:hypothetical protein